MIIDVRLKRIRQSKASKPERWLQRQRDISQKAYVE